MSYFKEDKKYSEEKHSSYLSELGDICLEELMLSSDAYICMIKLNMHGYKRLHRYLSKKFHDFYLRVQNNSLESTGRAIDNNSSFEIYTVKDLKEHLIKWNEKLEIHLKKVGEIIRGIFEEEGYISCTAQEIQRCLFKNLIKNERAIRKFEDCGWSHETIYVHDKYLHEKIKNKEEKHKY